MVRQDDLELQPILNDRTFLPINFRLSELGKELLGFNILNEAPSEVSDQDPPND